ncbi:MAG: transglycosylase domain-containing protein [Hyphomonadaceae bacterium]|nr:transglycosylase domain-containing protein [Hyphomonadaceae bacterium]
MTEPMDARTLKRRLPVWAALSDLFLDTDVTLFYADIAAVLRKSRYTPEDIEHILWEEVGPAFHTNLLADDRVWSSWPHDDVHDIIMQHLSRPSLERYAMQQASANVVAHVIDQHWGAVMYETWGDRAPQRRAALQLPRIALPQLTLPALPELRLPDIKLRQMNALQAAGLAIAIALVLLVGFAAYQGAAVLRAQARTQEVLERAWAQAGPPISRELQVSWIEALLRVEDPGFRLHRGVDFTTPGQGWTTITQALTKRLYFESFTPGFAKIEQSLIARFVLDSAISKDEQLDLFLSLAYFGDVDGRSVIGFRNAAQAYHGKALGELNRQEFLALVAMLPAPNDLRPGSAANAERVARIERLLDDECAPRDWQDVWLEACAP